MKSGDPPIIELLDEAGELLHSVVEGDGEVGETSIVLLVSWWTLGKTIVVIVIIDLLLQGGNVGLESLHLLSVDIIPNSDSGSKSVDDGSELVSRWVGGGGKDVLYGGGG